MWRPSSSAAFYKAAGSPALRASAGRAAHATTPSFRPRSQTSTLPQLSTSMTLLKCARSPLQLLFYIILALVVFIQRNEFHALFDELVSRNANSVSSLFNAFQKSESIVFCSLHNKWLLTWTICSTLSTEYSVAIAEFLKFKLMADPIMQTFYIAVAEVWLL